MLRWRLIVGAGLVAALAALCWLDVRADRPGAYLAPLAVAAAWLAAGEMLRLFRAGNSAPADWTVYAGVLLPVLASAAAVLWHDRPAVIAIGRLGWLALGLTAGLAAALIGEMRRYDAPGRSVAAAAQAALAVLYVGGLLGMLVQLRLVPGWDAAWPLLPLASMIGVVKLSDTCQYIAGRTLGKHKLAPRISPGKTWEGAIYGILLATAIGTMVLAALLEGKMGFKLPRLAIVAAYCLTLAVVGLVGDLAESLLKRDAGVKDSSDWLPGFGGVLDLLDSLLLAAPAAYLWWTLGVL